MRPEIPISTFSNKKNESNDSIILLLTPLLSHTPELKIVPVLNLIAPLSRTSWCAPTRVVQDCCRSTELIYVHGIQAARQLKPLLGRRERLDIWSGGTLNMVEIRLYSLGVWVAASEEFRSPKYVFNARCPFIGGETYASPGP